MANKTLILGRVLVTTAMQAQSAPFVDRSTVFGADGKRLTSTAVAISPPWHMGFSSYMGGWRTRKPVRALILGWVNA